MRDRRSVIQERSIHCILYTVASLQYRMSCEMNSRDSIATGKDVVLAPRSIWYQPRSMWIIWFHVFMEELSFAFYRLKLDPVFPARNLFDGFQSAKLTALRGRMVYQ